MLLAYLDESYTADFYYMAALVVPQAAVAPLGDALDAIVMKASTTYEGLDPRAEFHANALLAGKGDWKPLRDVMRARLGIYEDVIQTIVDYEASVILRGVDRRRLVARYPKPVHPHSIVLNHLIERVDEYAKKRNDLAILFADEVDQQDVHRRQLWHCQRNGTWGYRGHPITHVIDTMYFAPSHASRLLQAADMVAHLYRRRQCHVETDPRSERAWASLWERLEPAVTHSRCWRP